MASSTFGVAVAQSVPSQREILLGGFAKSLERLHLILRHASAIGVAVAHVIDSGGRDLDELLVRAGLARIYGTRTPLPDGRDSREYLAHLHALENEAKATKRGGWDMVQR